MLFEYDFREFFVLEGSRQSKPNQLDMKYPFLTRKNYSVLHQKHFKTTPVNRKLQNMTFQNNFMQSLSILRDVSRVRKQELFNNGCS